MPATVSVIMQRDVEKLGKSGELVRVRPGYARNFLIPRELALPASSAAVNRLAHEKAVAQARAEKAKKEANDLSSKLGAVELKLAHRAGDDGKLFGSVTSKDIEVALKAKGFDIDKRKIALGEPIRQVGTIEVPIRLDAGIVATLKVEVAAK